MGTNLEVERLLLRINQVAHAPSISGSSAYKMFAKGELPVVRIRGGTRVPTDAQRQWIAQQLAERSEKA